MLRRMTPDWRSTNLLVSLVVLGTLLWFTYSDLIAGPYAGFYFHPANGQLLDIYVETQPPDILQKGDLIKRIGEFSFPQYAGDMTLSFFENTQPGDVIKITVNRNGDSLTVLWRYPGFNQNEFLARFFNIWWLGYIFWGFGLATQLFVRPKDSRWRLFLAANYLTAIWLITGNSSAMHIAGSALLFHAVTWLILPVFLNLHWDFPGPLLQIHKATWPILYLAGCALAFLELLQLLPHFLYSLGFLIALLGSTLLLLAHFVWQPARRQEMGFLLAAILFAVMPSIGLSLLAALANVPQIGPLTLLFLPAMPGAYFYVIYRRQLGGLEIRTNRIVSIYFYFILLVMIFMLLLTPAILAPIPSEAMVFILAVVSFITAFVSIFLFPVFQSFVERRLLGIKLPVRNLVENYSARIITSTSLPGLLKLLEEEVFPSLLVRQYAFVRIANASAKIMLSKNVTNDQVEEEAVMRLLASSGPGRLLLSSNDDHPLGWVRLILPLQLGSDLIGAWLLGRRDPDDLYPQAELPILQSLANQTAIALSNILQTERLHKMYEDDIERNEKSRHQLALDLHDSVLNQLAILRLSVDDTHVSPNFQGAYDEVTSRLREIVTELRPLMLSYGLKFAIEELADNLMERSKDTVKVVTDVQADGETRCAENIEQHLFRIVQESCENALRHSHATQIKVSAKLTPERIWLSIEDNGIGLETGGPIDLDDLLANKHFGLAGMVERAALIGAKVEINSFPKTGTHIQITWDVNND